MRASDVGGMIVVGAMLAAGFVQAELVVIESPNGPPGTITDLGNGVGIRSDPHGQGGPSIAPRESPAPLSPGPHGEMNQRLMSPFGSPQPPNQLTPAPVLPFNPNRPLMPSSSPPARPNSSSGHFGR